MKKFVEPHLEVGTEFKLHGNVWVVEELIQNSDPYNGDWTEVKYHLKGAHPGQMRFVQFLEELIDDMWQDSDEYQASNLVEQLKHIEYKVGTFTDISDEDKSEIVELISKIKNKLKVEE